VGLVFITVANFSAVDEKRGNSAISRIHKCLSTPVGIIFVVDEKLVTVSNVHTTTRNV